MDCFCIWLWIFILNSKPCDWVWRLLWSRTCLCTRALMMMMMKMMLVAHGRHLLPGGVMKPPLLLEPAAHLISLILQTWQSGMNKLLLQPSDENKEFMMERKIYLMKRKGWVELELMLLKSRKRKLYFFS